jgi:hypothetical protein
VGRPAKMGAAPPFCVGFCELAEDWEGALATSRPGGTGEENMGMLQEGEAGFPGDRGSGRFFGVRGDCKDLRHWGNPRLNQAGCWADAGRYDSQGGSSSLTGFGKIWENSTIEMD